MESGAEMVPSKVETDPSQALVIQSDILGTQPLSYLVWTRAERVVSDVEKALSKVLLILSGVFGAMSLSLAVLTRAKAVLLLLKLLL